MRREKTVKIGSRKITVREILVREIEEMYQAEAGIEIVFGFLHGDHEYIPFMMEKLTDLRLDEIREMGIVEYKGVLDALREVNADFFATWGKEFMMGRRAQTESPSQS